MNRTTGAIIVLLMAFTFEAHSMSFFRSIGSGSSPTPSDPAPAPAPAPTPEPTPEPEPEPTPAPEPTPQPPTPIDPDNGNGGGGDDVAGFDIFSEVAFPVGDSVDRYYSRYQELLPARGPASAHTTDHCDQKLRGHNSFADRIAYFVHKHTEDTRAHVAHLSSFYNVPANLNTHAKASLISHPLCRATRATLTDTIGSQRVPNNTVIAQLNEFSDRHNSLRERVINDQDVDAEIELNQLWTRFMSCLAYTESLTTADISSSHNVARKYAPAGYQKPSGVKFYEDPWQPEASRLNIGLFQFTPTASGNVNPCLRHWNEMYPQCTVATNANRAELIRVFGSSYQTFNAFCGVNKLLQTFAIQLNSNVQRNTHPDNYTNGMKRAQNRCVTPFFFSGWAYNHFGPLMNSTGSNLSTLMTCTLR